MNLFIYISVILTFVILWTPILKKHRKEHPEFYNYLFTLVATFFGVFVAIELTNENDRKNELENVLSIMKATKNSIVSTRVELVNLNVYTDTESVNPVLMFPVGFPDLYEKVVSSDIVIKNFSTPAIFYFYLSIGELHYLQRKINSSLGSNDSSINVAIKEYDESLVYAQQLLSLQIDVMEKNIKDEDVLNKIFNSIPYHPRAKLFE